MSIFAWHFINSAILIGIKKYYWHMEKQKVIISRNLEENLTKAIEECKHDRLFVLMDETTGKCCWDVVKNFDCVKNAERIVIGETDAAKNLDTLAYVWKRLSDGKCTRASLMINLGGGMVTDLGGFAASTFKRGINFINIPTTLLSMVDASVGGKTGINFNGLKNEVGTFCTASSVILDTEFLKTLDLENIRSGYAEMLKHGLISNVEHWAELVNFDLDNVDYALLGDMVARSVAVKENIVVQDPREKGLRKALNLGHTVGHGFESLSIAKGNPVLHGYAVAWGLVGELYLSSVFAGFPTERMRQTVRFIRENYGRCPFSCKDYEKIYELMTHDKKNTSGKINFTLLADIGDIRLDQTASKEDIFEMLDFVCEA